MEKTTVHIVGCPGNPSREFPTIDPFSRSSFFLTTKLTEEGWGVNYYGYEESTVKCTKKFGVVNLNWKENYIPHTENDAPSLDGKLDEDFSFKVYEELIKNVKGGDIVICMWSTMVDYLQRLGISRSGVFVIDGHVGHYNPSLATSYHVYAGHALKSWHYGKHTEKFNSRYHDTVISPISHTLHDYTYSPVKEDYFLFMSRLVEVKGLQIVLDIAKNLPDHKFKIAGSGDWSRWSATAPPNVEYIGYLDGEKRKKMLSEAKAVITPSIYFEPYGLTSIEAAISGTPIITTDWGGYSDNVVHGVTGFRCVVLNDFIEAIENIDTILSEDCMTWGRLHSAEELIKQWKKYLVRVKRGDWYNLTSSEEIEESFKI